MIIGRWKKICRCWCRISHFVGCEFCRRTFTFQMTGRQKYTAAMTGTIQGPIYLHLAQEWLSWCDSGLWGWLAGGGTQGSLGSLPSSAWQELAPASTNLSERNSELLPSRYFVTCHHRGKCLMLRFRPLLFTGLGRCDVCLQKDQIVQFWHRIPRLNSHHHSTNTC